MNKKLVALVAAAMMSISAGSVFAADNNVTLDSSLSIQYRHNTSSGNDSVNGSKTTFVTNAKIGLSKNVDFYGRIAAQHLTQPGFGNDFFAGNTEADNISLDQYGIIVKGGDNNFVYKLGRQSIALGANETIYSSGGYYGDYSSADGITITGKSGVVDLKAVAAKEDTHPVFGSKNKIYGLEASYKPSDAWTLGTTLARYNFSALDLNTNIYAVNAGYTFSPKANIMTEYAKSNADSDNKAYNAVFNYTFDNKLSGSFTYHRTEAAAYPAAFIATATPISQWEWTGFDAGYKGFYLGLDYKMTKDYTLSVFYKNNTNLNNDTKATSLRTTVSYKF